MHADLRRAALVAGVLAVAVTACGPVPQPFRPPDDSKVHNEFLMAPNSTGVVVERIEGPVGWVGDALADAMAGALREHGIVAASGWSNSRSRRLTASGYQQLHDANPAELVMTWVLREPSGRELELREIRTVPEALFWETPTAEMFDAIAARNAESVAVWLRPTPRAPAATTPSPSVALAAIVGAPGDGAESLGRAIRAALRGERVRLAAKGGGDLTVSPEVAVTAFGAGEETVRITWVLRTPDGAEIGTVAQENTIPKGELDGPWGAAAAMIADGAASGIGDLVRAFGVARAAGKLQPKQ